VRQVAGKLLREHSLASVGDALIPLEDYYGLVGLRAMLEREEGYDRAAASLRNT
jgi:methylisocitrate lyase